ncbi:hypothetical protein BASA83_005307 [Batrachochytrium salamandrivorans]|nr:hypothetical protein BASA83_005307 [Batrachochytrium salamandrivorans]
MANSDNIGSLCRSSARTIITHNILDILALQPSRSLTSAPFLAPILGHQMEHVSKIDRRTTKHGARFRITVPEDRQRKQFIQRLERQSKQTHWRIRQNYRHRRPDQTRPTAPPPHYHGRFSQSMLPISANNVLLFAISSGTPGSGHLRDLHHLIQIPLYCPWIRCHPASSHGTWTQRNRPRYPIVLWWP